MAEEADNKKPCTFFKKKSGARAAVRKRRHVSEDSGKDDDRTIYHSLGV